MILSLSHVHSDGAAVALAPNSLRRRRLSAPSFKQYAVSFGQRHNGEFAYTATVVWCIRRRWDRLDLVNFEGPWVVMPIGPFFVIALRIRPFEKGDQ